MGLSLAGPSGVGPGLHALSWLACVDPVTDRPVSRTICHSTGDSARALGPFRVDADTSPSGSDDAIPGSPACVTVFVRELNPGPLRKRCHRPLGQLSIHEKI